jgi:hypothetical protein
VESTAARVNGAIVKEETYIDMSSPVLDHQRPLKNWSAVQATVCNAIEQGVECGMRWQGGL